MSDKLKKYFLEQRAAFDVEQPPKEVWPHIEQGLNDKSTPLKEHIKSQRTAFDVETPPPFLWDRIENKLSENEPTLQKHIEDQRTDFDVELPPNSLWERIENKLDTTQEETLAPRLTNTQQTQTKELKLSRSPWKRYLSIAAMIMVAFGLGWFVSQNVLMNKFEQRHVQLAKIAPEVAEAEQFYLTGITTYKDDLKNYKEIDPKLVEEFLNEHEQLDQFYLELKGMLSQDVDNQKILDLMIQNLQMRTKVLKKQQSILQSIKRKKKDETLL